MEEAINFERKYGSGEFIKAVITTLNRILIDKGIVTKDELLDTFRDKIKEREETYKLEKKPGIHRKWVRWKGNLYCDEGYREPPFQYWKGKSFDRMDERKDYHLYAVIDVESGPNCNQRIWDTISEYFTEYERRGIETKNREFLPDKKLFPDFVGKTSLVG